MTTLSNNALAVIDAYLHFKVGGAECLVPYFNNKTVQARAALPVHVGKGSPAEIAEEVEASLFKHRISKDTLTGEELRRFMTDNNIGVDCSGFAYHVLDAESVERGHGPLAKHLAHAGSGRFMAKLLHAMKPVRNTGVTAFADDANSRPVPVAEAAPGDIITMIDGDEGSGRNHILVVHEVEQAAGGGIIRYSDAVAYPEDGLHGSGVKQGEIEITDPTLPITDQHWTENGRAAADNPIYARALRSKTELRRLAWF